MHRTKHTGRANKGDSRKGCKGKAEHLEARCWSKTYLALKGCNGLLEIGERHFHPSLSLNEFHLWPGYRYKLISPFPKLVSGAPAGRNGLLERLVPPWDSSCLPSPLQHVLNRVIEQAIFMSLTLLCQYKDVANGNKNPQIDEAKSRGNFTGGK